MFPQIVIGRSRDRPQATRGDHLSLQYEHNKTRATLGQTCHGDPIQHRQSATTSLVSLTRTEPCVVPARTQEYQGVPHIVQGQRCSPNCPGRVFRLPRCIREGCPASIRSFGRMWQIRRDDLAHRRSRSARCKADFLERRKPSKTQATQSVLTLSILDSCDSHFSPIR